MHWFDCLTKSGTNWKIYLSKKMATIWKNWKIFKFCRCTQHKNTKRLTRLKWISVSFCSFAILRGEIFHRKVDSHSHHDRITTHFSTQWILNCDSKTLPVKFKRKKRKCEESTRKILFFNHLMRQKIFAWKVETIFVARFLWVTVLRLRKMIFGENIFWE